MIGLVFGVMALLAAGFVGVVTLVMIVMNPLVGFIVFSGPLILIFIAIRRVHGRERLRRAISEYEYDRSRRI